MNRFVLAPRDVRENQIYRDALLAQPPEFFLSHFGIPPDPIEKLSFVEKLIQMTAAPHLFVNDVYMVRVRQASPFVQLDIARRDGQPGKSWRDFQRIKNELVGPECEAVELFPAESRLVDTSNQYHLWVYPDPANRFPFGYSRRFVLDKPIVYRGRAGDEVPVSEGLPLAHDNTVRSHPEESAS